jgi:hypothetical protein
MKTKLFTALVLAAALLIGEPAFAATHHAAGRGGRGHTFAAVHRASRGRAIAAVHRGNFSRGTALASRRTVNAHVTRGIAANRVNRTTINSRVNRTSIAFGGNANNAHGRYAFASHQGWDHGRQYFWNGHHYRWYGNGWFIIDPFPYYGYGYYNGNYPYGYQGSGSVSVQVQAALSQQGYYRGPVDGVVGPGTQAAIAAYQRDNGLPVTGTITAGLLSDLGVG